MPQSLAQIYLHVVFSTKNRKPFLVDPAIRSRLHEYLGGTCNGMDCPSIRVGGVEDHVHILCRFGRSTSVADFVRDLKKESSKWIKDKWTGLKTFQWQTGYGAFSISPSHVALLTKSIENQETHHKSETFQDEYRRLLRKYKVDWDERYVWGLTLLEPRWGSPFRGFEPGVRLASSETPGFALQRLWRNHTETSMHQSRLR